MRYSDPSGHAPQSPGDPDPNNAPCSTDWCWQNRWYRAHGAVWNGSDWSINGSDAHFYDSGIANDVATEHGLTFTGSWIPQEINEVLKGVVHLSNAMRGVAQFTNLLGPLEMNRIQKAAWWQFGLKNAAAWYDNSRLTFTNAASRVNTIILTVHELGHALDDGVGNLGAGMSNIAKSTNLYPTNYAKKNNDELFAEAVTVGVFGTRYTGPLQGRPEESRANQVMLGLSSPYVDYIGAFLTVNQSAIVP